MGRQSYRTQFISEGWSVRELKRQMKSCLFQRLVLSPYGVSALANEVQPHVGIALGARKGGLLIEYAMQGITNQLFTSRYQLYLPSREELHVELDKLLAQ